MPKSPAFQFYPKDWLSSVNVLMMTPEQEGAYIRLLAYCWDSGDCSIPDDDGQLLIMSRLFKGGSTNPQPAGCEVVPTTLLAAVKKCFVPHPRKPGFLTNKRLLEEHGKQAAWREKSAKGGRQSVESKRKFKGGSRVVQPTPNRPVEPNANPSSSSSAKSVEKGKPFSYTPAFEELWATYPRRDGSKADAFRHYQQATQGGAPHEVIIRGARQYADYVNRNGVGKRYIAHASTWISQRRWESNYDDDRPYADGQPEHQLRNRAAALGAPAKRTWASEGERLAAKYRAEAEREECGRQASLEHRPG